MSKAIAGMSKTSVAIVVANFALSKAIDRLSKAADALSKPARAPSKVAFLARQCPTRSGDFRIAAPPPAQRQTRAWEDGAPRDRPLGDLEIALLVVTAAVAAQKSGASRLHLQAQETASRIERVERDAGLVEFGGRSGETEAVDHARGRPSDEVAAPDHLELQVRRGQAARVGEGKEVCVTPQLRASAAGVADVRIEAERAFDNVGQSVAIRVGAVRRASGVGGS